VQFVAIHNVSKQDQQTDISYLYIYIYYILLLLLLLLLLFTYIKKFLPTGHENRIKSLRRGRALSAAADILGRDRRRRRTLPQYHRRHHHYRPISLAVPIRMIFNISYYYFNFPRPRDLWPPRVFPAGNNSCICPLHTHTHIQGAAAVQYYMYARIVWVWHNNKNPLAPGWQLQNALGGGHLSPCSSAAREYIIIYIYIYNVKLHTRRKTVRASPSSSRTTSAGFRFRHSRRGVKKLNSIYKAPMYANDKYIIL